MICLSVYNEKGGVGKTTVTAMLASFLAYAGGKRVRVIDMDNPAFHLHDMRSRELVTLRDPSSPLALWLKEHPETPAPYDIIRLLPRKDGVYNPEALLQSIDDITGSGAQDYILYDLPGRLTPDSPAAVLAANGYLDRVFIPIDTDRQSRQSGMLVADTMHSLGVPVALFWNRVSVYEAKGSAIRFQRGAEPFLSRGFPVMDEMIRDIRKFSRDSSERTFIRSTLCFPDRYVNMWIPTLIPFLEALRARIDNPQP